MGIQIKQIIGLLARLLPSGGTSGQVLKKTSGTDYAVAWGDEGLDRFQYVETFTDCLNAQTTANTPANDGDFSFFSQGTSASVLQPATDFWDAFTKDNAVGVVRLNSGLASNGSASVTTGAAFQCATNADATCEVIFTFTTLPTSAENYVLPIGFFNTNSSTPTIGCYFLLGFTGSAAYFQSQTRTAAGTATTTTLTVPTVSTIYRLKVVMNTTQTDFYVNGVLVASHTTNIPTAITSALRAGIALIKTAGTTSRIVHVDAVRVRRYFAATRF